MLKFNTINKVTEVYDNSHRFLGWLKPNKFSKYAFFPAADSEFTAHELSEITCELSKLNKA
jgi:hypothetical protein